MDKIDESKLYKNLLDIKEMTHGADSPTPSLKKDMLAIRKLANQAIALVKPVKKYYKVVPIEAEQYDGSYEMSYKYHIDVDGYGNCALPTMEGKMDLVKGDWLATGVKGEHWVIREEVFKKTYQEVINDER